MGGFILLTNDIKGMISVQGGPENA
jgi:hypothetical protein